MSLPLIIVGALLVLDTVFASLLSNFNLGVILPMMLGAPILIYGLFFERLNALCATGFFNVLRSCAIICYIIFILLFIVCLVLMLTAPRLDSDERVDALIVLGAAVHGDTMSLTLQNRVDAAIDYMQVHKDTVCVVSGGQGSGENLPEAVAMSEYMYEQGIDRDRVFVEATATSTEENFEFSKLILDEQFTSDYSIAFVTTDFHVYRAGLFAHSVGYTDAHGISSTSAWWMWPNFYLREFAAIVHGWVT